MAYQRVHQKTSAWSPTFNQDHSESLFKPRPFSVQSEADTEEAETQEIPAYTRFDRDAISTNLLKTMGANVQTLPEVEVQKSESESKEEDSEEISNETEKLQRTGESGEAGDDDDKSPNGAAIQRLCDKCESEQHSQGMQAEESDEEKSQEAGAIQRQSELEAPEDDVTSIQAKLTVGAPGDKYEQEADSVAAQVMSMSLPSAPSMPIQRQEEKEEQEPSVQGSSLADSITPLVQRQPEEKEEPLQAKSLLQRKANGSAEAGSSLESQLNQSKGGGSPLPNDVRSFMEPRFGADFSTVRVHTDSTAVQMNKDLGAQAFAHGSDIYYGAGKSPGNNELTAHELTHTIQQGGAVPLNKQVQRQAKEEEEQETLQAKELPNRQGEVSLNKEVQPAETLVAKALPGEASQLSLNKELRLKPESTDEETEVQPIQAKQYTSLDVSSVSPRIQGDFFGIPTSLEEAKRKILSPVAQLASGIPGYPLLKVILGKDPISETPVERNATNLIQGVLSLVPKGQEFFANLQQSGAIDKAYNWFNEQIAKLNLTWETIKGLFKKAWDSLGLGDLVSPSSAFEKIKNVFGEPINRIKNFAINAGTKVMEFVFEGVMGAGGAKVMGIIRRAGGVFNTIVSDPIKFIGNLVGAVKGGFQQFSGNIVTHLKSGLVGWLFGALAGAGLTLPAQFDLKGIVSLALQVLGLTYQRLRGMLVKLIGEPKVAKLEKAFDFLMMIVTQGLGAAWQKITEFVGGLQEMVMGGIRDWVQNSIITAAITKLISMFNPAGAIIQAVMAIYNTIMFFIERGSQIAAVGEAVFSSIGTIAAGNIAGAATYVEQTMGRTLPVVISFLARLIGLGGISEQIKNVIKKIQSPIETAMTKVANFIVEKGKSLLGKGNKDKEGKEGEKTDDGESVALPFSMNGSPHTLTLTSGSTAKVLMASNNPGLLSEKISRAINELETNVGQPQVNERMAALKNIKDLASKVEKTLHDSKASSDDKKLMKNEGIKLITDISKYGDKYGAKDIEEALKLYPAPVVGLYNEILNDKTPPPDGTTREAHHAPPFELAQTLSTELLNASEAFLNKGIILPHDYFEEAANKIGAAGENLPAILVHASTHRIKGAGSRIHGSEIRAELTKRLEKDGIPREEAIITSNNQLSVKAGNKGYKRFISNVEGEALGNRKKKIRTALQDGDVDAVKLLFRKAYNTAAAQTLHQVEIALEGSKFDGSEANKKAAVTNLRVKAKEVWKDKLLKSLD